MENYPSPNLLRLGGGKERQEVLVWVPEKSEDTAPSETAASLLLARKIQFNAAFGGLLVAEKATLTHFLIILAVGTETTNDGWN